MLPWWLLSLTPRDQAQPVIRLWNQNGIQSAVSTLAFVQWQVPSEYFAIITAYSAQATPDGGTTPEGYFLSIAEPGISAPFIFGNNFIGAALGKISRSTQFCYILAPPGSFITAAATFAAATGPNAISCAIAAVLIPRGTMQML